MSTVETEQVLVIPTTWFHHVGYFQGFTRDADKYLRQLFDPKQTQYRPRDEMEKDPDFKQLIPYVLFQATAEDGRVSLFQYQRGRGQGERRLHSKRSIGLGGHISFEDAQPSVTDSPYLEGMQRELDEEVRVDTPYHQQCVGLINDDKTNVGKVHLGIVHLCQVQRPYVYPRESEILAAGFRPLEILLQERDQFESWSQICLDTLFSDSHA